MNHERLKYHGNLVIAIRGDLSQSILQRRSQRRAVIHFLTEMGGRCTVQELEAHFGQDMGKVIANLEAAGWIGLCAEGTGLPRRSDSLKTNLNIDPEDQVYADIA